MLKNSQNEGYIAGLDGLRAFAVLAVFVYHFGFSWARGGFLGVDIFFVLSGYLITSIMLPHQENELNIKLREFWIGRIRRLLPAAYVMIISTFTWVMLFRQDLLHTVQGDAISSIFYTSNWWFIFHKLSYFDSFGSLSPLKNLWSLAIEEQFYLLWPMILAAGIKLLKKRGRMSVLVLFLAFCSAGLMGLLFEPGTDPSRVYYGTDTRSFELLIGCFLAILFPMKKLAAVSVSNGRRNLLNLAGIAAFTIFLLSVYFVDEYQQFPYRGGLLLFCFNSALLIACVCHSGSLLGRLFSWKPLRWMGTRSYGIYLWHYPVIVLSTPVYEIGHPAYWRVTVQLLVTFAIAELSYRFIEMPVRRLGLKGYLKNLLTRDTIVWKGPLARRISTTLASFIILILVVGVTGLAYSDVPAKEAGAFPDEMITGKATDSSILADTGKDSDEKQEESEGGDHSAIQENDAVYENGEVTVPAEEKEGKDDGGLGKPSGIHFGTNENRNSPSINQYEEILAIGDSVMIGISSSLNQKYSNITIDGKVGRQMSQAVELAPGYASFNDPDKAVIIELGTNGYFTEEQLNSLLESFSESPVYLVNIRVPRPWEFKVNEALAKKAMEKENITLIDWYSEAINHPEYFSPDGVHLLPKGVEVLTSLIDQALISSGSAAEQLTK
ncbi:acyltransferase family protein [Sinanaerobacter chloroacetimidivorans]|uniref:Acetyltransferase n=1 Tax=Sinanaerobacter chloroacetimidivorans TaxID=2818044 RepID=A0A8J7W3F0_9FIRM|nr:acyltransferase family protein [Sinanaerobacter chloroacetimidivorans]MBR0599661.1 acetyltransferase [Sinanaerobacter chloroacetimidivorans]